MSDFGDRTKVIATGVTAAAATFAYFAQRAVLFADPGMLFTGGLILAVGVMSVWFWVHDEKPSRIWTAAVLCECTIGALVLLWQILVAESRIDATAPICRSLATEMIAKPAAREANAAAFTALNCGYSLRAGDQLLPFAQDTDSSSSTGSNDTRKTK